MLRSERWHGFRARGDRGAGPEIFHLDDKNGDGKADDRRVLMKGFGVQDTHPLPHQFTRMPGGQSPYAPTASAHGAVARVPPASYIRRHPMTRVKTPRLLKPAGTDD